jgi:transcriptional/translational regulatory protein YebC/TACO1
VCLIVETESDNTRRTIQELRALARQHDVVFPEAGAALFQFEQRGLVTVITPGLELEENSAVPDDILAKAIDAGAEDVRIGEGGRVELLCDPAAVGTVRDAAEALGMQTSEAYLVYVPTSRVSPPPAERERYEAFLDAVASHSDVVRYYDNCDQVA